MPHLTDLNGAPMTWDELWRKHEAYYAARAERERVCGFCDAYVHSRCSGWMSADGRYRKGLPSVPCLCDCRERAQRDAGVRRIA